MNLRLFPKIALLLILLAAVPVAIVGWQTATLNREHLESNILELQTNLANSLSNRIDLYLASLSGRIRAFVETLRIQGIESAEPFRAFLESNVEFVSLSFVNPSGKELIKAAGSSYPEERTARDRLKDAVFNSYFHQGIAVGPASPKLGFYFEKDDPRLSIVFPYDPGKMSLGAVYLVVSLKDLWKQIATEGAGVG